MVNKITFAMRLKKLREQKRLNQTELANLLKVSNGSISKWERGDRQPDYETLEKIADTFNVTSVVTQDVGFPVTERVGFSVSILIIL